MGRRRGDAFYATEFGAGRACRLHTHIWILLNRHVDLLGKVDWRAGRLGQHQRLVLLPVDLKQVAADFPDF